MTGVFEAQVQLLQGTICGVNRDDHRRFCGIPYALQPVGPLRWCAPKPVSPGRDLIPAENFGPMAPQVLEDVQDSGSTSEACLNLNIWTPRATTKAPVMVWIHGGGFCQGSNRIRGSLFAQSGVVLVAPNYRLGVLGFAAHPLIKDPGANFGLLDLVQALRWVQENIEQFGGDPSNVTIFGVSAGGAAVNLLMTIPSAEGLFHKAIAQSGYGTWPLLRGHPAQAGPLDILHRASQSAEESTAAVFERAGFEDPDLASLMNAAPERLVGGQRGFQLPIVDGDHVTEEPGLLFEQGRMVSVPYLTGANSFDGSVMPSYQLEPGAYSVVLDDFSLQWRTLYGADLDEGETRGIQRVFGDERYLLSAALLADAVAKTGEDAFLYYLDITPPGFPERLGSPHGFDAFLMFESAALYPESVEAKLGQNIREAWISFAQSGRPAVISEDDKDWRPIRDGGAWHHIGGASGISSSKMNERLDWLKHRYRARVAPSVDQAL